MRHEGFSERECSFMPPWSLRVDVFEISRPPAGERVVAPVRCKNMEEKECTAGRDPDGLAAWRTSPRTDGPTTVRLCFCS